MVVLQKQKKVKTQKFLRESSEMTKNEKKKKAKREREWKEKQ